MTSGYMSYLDLVWNDEEYIGVVPVVEDSQLYLVVARNWEEDEFDTCINRFIIDVCHWQDSGWQETRVWERGGNYEELSEAWQVAGTRARESPSDALLKTRL